MGNHDILKQYSSRGIEVDISGYLSANGFDISASNAEKFRKDRWKAVDKFLPVVGRKITEKDLPDDMPPEDKISFLNSFSPAEKQDISRMALFHETAPSRLYWQETADKLFPEVNPALAKTYSMNISCDDAAAGIMSDISTLISRRTRDQSELRGDKDSLDAFSTAITTSTMRLPPSLRCDLAAHYIAHSRIYQRAKSHFNILAEHLPEEAGDACQAIRAEHLEPEILESHNYLSKLDTHSFEKQYKFAQQDVLNIAKVNVSTRIPGNDSLSPIQRLEAKSQIGATRKLIDKASEHGLYSDAMRQANNRVFALSKLTRNADICMVAPEAIRQARAQELSRFKQSQRTSTQVEL